MGWGCEVRVWVGEVGVGVGGGGWEGGGWLWCGGVVLWWGGVCVCFMRGGEKGEVVGGGLVVFSCSSVVGGRGCVCVGGAAGEGGGGWG